LRYWVSLCTVSLVVCLGFCVCRAFAVGTEDAAATVSAADSALQGAFLAVAAAENSGANVSGLMGRMNEAGADLEEARLDLVAGNYSGAVSYAGECKGLAETVLSDAGVLKSEAVAAGAKWWITLSLSLMGSAIFVTVLYVVWRRCKGFYSRRILKSRPEAVD
jgi:hypothetical protein